MSGTSTPRRSARIQNPHSVEGSSSIKSVVDVNTEQETSAMKANRRSSRNVSVVNIVNSHSQSSAGDVLSFDLGISQPTDKPHSQHTDKPHSQPSDNLPSDKGTKSDTEVQPKKKIKRVAKKRIGLVGKNNKRKIEDEKQKEIVDDDDDFMDDLSIPKSTTKASSAKKKQRRNQPSRDVDNMNVFDKCRIESFGRWLVKTM